MTKGYVKERHHTVPQFLLRRFANDRDQVTRVVLPGTKTHPQTIRNATVHKHFYLAPSTDGGLTDDIETALGTLETHAATAVHTLLDQDTWPIPAETREHLAAWIAMQYLRVPAIRDHLAAADQLLVHLTGHDDGPSRTLADQLAQNPYRTTHLETMLEGFLPATQLIYQRGWNLVRFRRKALIIADTPVALLPRDDADDRTPLGLASNGGIVVNLDRRVAVMMTEHPIDLRLDGTTARARAFNQAQASNARECVFHHPDDAPLHGITLPEPREPAIRWEHHPCHRRPG